MLSQSNKHSNCIYQECKIIPIESELDLQIQSKFLQQTSQER